MTMKHYCDAEGKIHDCDGKYNLKDSSILTDKPGKGTMIRLSPERFLKLTTSKSDPSFEEAKALGVNFKYAEDVHEAMCNEEPLDPMFLEFDQDEEKITGHEGRMRAMVAKESKVSSIPVKLFCEERKDGRIRTTQCDVTSGIDLVRKAEPQSNLEAEKFQEQAREFKKNCD